jgi:hypothetical protein
LVEDKNNGGAWKWVAGALAIALSYNVGYESGFSAKRPQSLPPAAELSYEATPDVTAVDGPGLPVDPMLTAAAGPPAADEVPTIEVPQHLKDKLAALTREPQPEEQPSFAAIGDDYSSFQHVPAEGESDEGLSAATVIASDEYADGAASEAQAASLAPVAASAVTSRYAAPKPVAVGCAENGSCYGDISSATDRAKTVAVGGYYRRDGTYVRGHYRSRPR